MGTTQTGIHTELFVDTVINSGKSSPIDAGVDQRAETRHASLQTLQWQLQPDRNVKRKNLLVEQQRVCVSLGQTTQRPFQQSRRTTLFVLQRGHKHGRL